MQPRYNPASLRQSVSDLFQVAGLSEPIAATVAEILVDADLLGYDTHGLQFVPAYLAALEAGRTRRQGDPEIVHDTGGALILDANRLPGQWATRYALELARERVRSYPVVCVGIRRSSNISCLAAYVKRAADAGLIAILMASAPDNAVVVPHLGRSPRYSTNPFAFAIPGDPHPILVDTSTSSTTNRMVERAARQKTDLAGEWLLDPEGKPTADPKVIFQDPPGGILPLGGMELGHKGFAFAILVEALTSGLTGAGRAQGSESGNNVFLQVMDPQAFGGLAGLKAETGYFAELCRHTPPRQEGQPVRIPGDRAYALYEQQLRDGVQLHPEIMARLTPCFEKYGLARPRPLGE